MPVGLALANGFLVLAPPAPPPPQPAPVPPPPVSQPVHPVILPESDVPRSSPAYVPTPGVPATYAPPVGSSGDTGASGDVEGTGDLTPTAGDWIDPESGDAGFTDDDLQALEDEADAVLAGHLEFLSATHPVPGTQIGHPYVGTHAKAFNVAGGSDNWESENAIDVWLFPGTHIVAPLDGVISPGGWGFGLSASGGRFAGWRVHLVSSGGRVFYLTHMAGLAVVKGQRLQQGDLIGYSGVANNVPHLHFAVNPPFAPGAFVRDAYDLKGRTSIGTSPKTGAPAAETPAKKPAGVVAQWRGLVDFFGDDVPKRHTGMKALADGLVEVLR